MRLDKYLKVSQKLLSVVLLQRKLQIKGESKSMSIVKVQRI